MSCLLQWGSLVSKAPLCNFWFESFLLSVLSGTVFYFNTFPIFSCNDLGRERVMPVKTLLKLAQVWYYELSWLCAKLALH